MKSLISSTVPAGVVPGCATLPREQVLAQLRAATAPTVFGQRAAQRQASAPTVRFVDQDENGEPRGIALTPLGARVALTALGQQALLEEGGTL